MKRALTQLLIAHKHNQYHPHLLRKTGLALTAILAVTILVATKPLGVWISRTSTGAAIYPIVLTGMANQSRSENKIGPLVVNPLLEKAALLKAKDMATKGYFAHQSPEGFTPWYWFKEAGYSYVYAGENLAIDFSESRDIQNAWMNSPGHRANILNPRYTEIGIATYEGMFEGRPTTFVVELFASPKASQPGLTAAVAQASWLDKIIAGPGIGAIVTYVLLSLVMIIALGSIFMTEIRIRDRRHILYACAILLAMALFIYLEWHVVFSTVRIA